MLPAYPSPRRSIAATWGKYWPRNPSRHLQHHQYTTLANLGTMLILDSLPRLLAGNSGTDTQSEMHRSLDCIERAIAINPGGHFGREVWQAILIEHLLAALDHPEMLDDFDMIGEPLSDQIDALGRMRLIYARRPHDLSKPNMSVEERLGIRWSIDRLGIDPSWAARVNPDYLGPMPFDEPTLAIVGMWSLGGGPNPHFALALGRIMQNIGQRNVAWNAYERAIELQAGWWPDPARRAMLVTNCRARQEEIAARESPDPHGWQETMRAQHTAELAWGVAYQKAYHDFEAAQIAAGVPLNDPGFYTSFFRGRPSIASSPGFSDDAIVTHKEASSLTDALPCMVLVFGLGMVFGLIVPGRRAGKKK